MEKSHIYSKLLSHAYTCQLIGFKFEPLVYLYLGKQFTRRTQNNFIVTYLSKRLNQLFHMWYLLKKAIAVHRYLSSHEQLMNYLQICQFIRCQNFESSIFINKSKKTKMFLTLRTIHTTIFKECSVSIHYNIFR